MKQGLLSLFLICSPAIAQLDEIDEFIGNGNSSVLIDIEDKTKADFNVVDDLTEREKRIERSLIIPPKPNKPRAIIKTAPYTAQLQKSAILISLDGKKKVKAGRNIIVKAQELSPGSSTVYILDKNGKKKYTTKTIHAANINHVVDIQPKISPLKVYTYKPTYSSQDKDIKLSHFLSLQRESISTSYFATIFRGEKQSASATTMQLKSYFLSERFPIYVGFNITSQLGYWEDPVLGTVTWSGVFFGPSAMRTFWKKKDSRWNLHLSAFRSLTHQSKKSPDVHKYSTLGFQTELEKEIDTSVGPFTFGVSYKWSQSSIKESSEYLENIAQKGQITSFGAYLSYRFNWSI